MVVLGIETTCDETAAAVVERPDGRGEGTGRGDILSNVVLSQIDQHAAFGGLPVQRIGASFALASRAAGRIGLKLEGDRRETAPRTELPRRRLNMDGQVRSVEHGAARQRIGRLARAAL